MYVTFLFQWSGNSLHTMKESFKTITNPIQTMYQFLNLIWHSWETWSFSTVALVKRVSGWWLTLPSVRRSVIESVLVCDANVCFGSHVAMHAALTYRWITHYNASMPNDSLIILMEEESRWGRRSDRELWGVV